MPLARSVSEILGDPNREWTPKPPADRDIIDELQKTVPFPLPSEYIELLAFCDGGFGELNAPPLLFDLDSIADSVIYNESDFRVKEFPTFWFFGDNGGMEQIAFDLRSGPPWQIVMIDPIAGPDSAEVIAKDMADFIEKIGIAADGTAE